MNYDNMDQKYDAFKAALEACLNHHLNTEGVALSDIAVLVGLLSVEKTNHFEFWYNDEAIADVRGESAYTYYLYTEYRTGTITAAEYHEKVALEPQLSAIEVSTRYWNGELLPKYQPESKGEAAL